MVVTDRYGAWFHGAAPKSFLKTDRADESLASCLRLEHTTVSLSDINTSPTLPYSSRASLPEDRWLNGSVFRSTWSIPRNGFGTLFRNHAMYLISRRGEPSPNCNPHPTHAHPYTLIRTSGSIPFITPPCMINLLTQAPRGLDHALRCNAHHAAHCQHDRIGRREPHCQHGGSVDHTPNLHGSSAAKP